MAPHSDEVACNWSLHLWNGIYTQLQLTIVTGAAPLGRAMHYVSGALVSLNRVCMSKSSVAGVLHCLVT